jgi:hypothetical protein
MKVMKVMIDANSVLRLHHLYHLHHFHHLGLPIQHQRSHIFAAHDAQQLTGLGQIKDA